MSDHHIISAQPGYQVTIVRFAEDTDEYHVVTEPVLGWHHNGIYVTPVALDDLLHMHRLAAIWAVVLPDGRAFDQRGGWFKDQAEWISAAVASRRKSLARKKPEAA